MHISILIATTHSDERPLLESLGQITISKDLTQTVVGVTKTAGETYRQLLKTNPDLLIADEPLFNAGVNLLCEHRAVILLTDTKDHAAGGNICYIYRPFQASHIIRRVKGCFRDVSEEELERRRTQFDTSIFPTEYLGDDEARLRMEDRIEERAKALELIRSGEFEFTQRKPKERGKINFYSDSVLDLMGETPTEQARNAPESAPTALSVVWITRPEKTLYAPGDRVSEVGGVVGVAFSDGQSKEVKLTADMLPEEKAVKAGQTEVIFHIFGKDLPLDITVRDRTITGLYISVPCRDSYREGEKPDISGLELLATWSDGSFGAVKDFHYEDRVLTLQDTQLVFQAGGHEVSMPIQVHPATISGLSWVKKPKTEYDAGEEPDLTGAVLKARYPDGSERELAVSEEMLVTQVGHLAPEHKLLLFRVGTCTIPLPIRVKEKNEPHTLMITKVPDRTQYPAGTQEFSLSGGKVICYWSNGSQEELDMDAPAITWDANLTKIGESPVQIQYRNLTANFMVQITEPKLIEMYVVEQPVKKKYMAGEKLDIEGLILNCVYDNGEEREVIQFPGAEMPVVHAGESVVQFRWEGKAIPIHVSVTSRVEVLRMMYKTTYLPGEPIDTSGLKLGAVYDDGTSIPIETFTVKEKAAQVGMQQIHVTASEQTITVPIQVQSRELLSISISAIPSKTQYLERKEEFSASGGELLLLYSDHTAKQIPMTNAMVSGFSNETPGQIGLTVSYGGQSTILPVMIIARALTGIAVVEEPFKLQYREGEIFDPDGLKLRGVYNNGETEILQNYTVDPARPLTVDDTGVKIKCMGKTAVVRVSVQKEEKKVEVVEQVKESKIPTFYPSTIGLRDID